MAELNTNFSPTVALDLPNAFAMRYQNQQRQRQEASQNAFAQALPMLGKDNQNALSTVAAAGDPEAYAKTLQIIGTLDTEKRAQATERADALGKAALTLKGQKEPIIRKAMLQSMATELKSHGITDEQIANFDPSDANLQTVINQATDLKGLIAQANQTKARLTSEEAVAAGYDADAPVFKDGLGNITSAVKPKAEIEQGVQADIEKANRVPATQAQLMADKTARRGQDKADARALESGAAWQVLTDPKANVQYRYNARTGQATTLDGSTAYSPGGAQKMGSGTVARSPAALYLQAYMGKNPKASPEDIMREANKFRAGQSEAGTIGTRSGAIDVAAAEVSVFAEQALEASKALPRGDYALLNSALQSWDMKTKNPQLRRLMIAADALVNARARAISPTGSPHVNDQLEGRKMLSAAFASGDFEAAVDQMQQEAEGVRTSTESTKAAAFGGAPAPAPAPAASSGWSNFKVHN